MAIRESPPSVNHGSENFWLLGQHLSAFHLKVRGKYGEMPLECAFQGSKVFERGGPNTDLYGADVRDAKSDSRLRDSWALIAFDFEGITFPLEPRTAIYDWLYVNAIYPHREWLMRLNRAVGGQRALVSHYVAGDRKR